MLPTIEFPVWTSLCLALLPSLSLQLQIRSCRGMFQPLNWILWGRMGPPKLIRTGLWRRTLSIHPPLQLFPGGNSTSRGCSGPGGPPCMPQGCLGSGSGPRHHRLYSDLKILHKGPPPSYLSAAVSAAGSAWIRGRLSLCLCQWGSCGMCGGTDVHFQVAIQYPCHHLPQDLPCTNSSVLTVPLWDQENSFPGALFI